MAPCGAMGARVAGRLRAQCTVHGFSKLVYGPRPFGRQTPVRQQLKNYGCFSCGSRRALQNPWFFYGGNKRGSGDSFKTMPFLLQKERNLFFENDEVYAIPGQIIVGVVDIV